MKRKYDRKIVFDDGTEYYGYSFGNRDEKILEIVFNTSMAGYQEIISDPSYTDQAIIMTYPLIGNYGMAADDYETDIPTAGALIVGEYNDEPSNFRAEKSLGEVMETFGVAGISGVDTRRLCRSVRDLGTRPVILTGAETPADEAVRKIKESVIPKDAVSRVSCVKPYVTEGHEDGLHVVAIDCGMKKNILRSLSERGCRVTVVPWNTSPDFIKSLRPDGVVISNGPGDPTDVPETVAAAAAVRGCFPLFGICLGHQIIALSYGAKTYKLKFGHRGGNHPVRDLETGRIEITSQNHSYAVDENSLPDGLAVTHRNILDGTVEGLRCTKDRVFSVQYHPESSPGPRDSLHLFDRFIAMMKEAGKNA